MYKLLTISLVT